ncbi:MAG: hypothetical protein EZS28_015661 [Streblomastix strix]|uniref:Uncharacterized protein n=1 Tax=Streblomastix strix TaxID=222440 RepID=A0A5J4W284_9EUKA|nr:MAG: hypothetical protein EZS28_015661 [Streblomastix strix]
MGFFSKIANFGSKILGGVKHATQWIAPTLHKVLTTVAGPAGMIHPGIGAALGAGSNLAGAVDRLYQKRGSGSGGGMLQNEDYQLFIDNDNALVYAANNQIIDDQASDFALKIAADVNQLQSTIKSIDADIVEVKNDIITIQQELARQQHFRGYYLLNTDIQNLSNSADGDFVPDQVTPASDVVPLVDSGAGVAGISTEYARGDHKHPLQISSVLPSADTAEGQAGTANTYARSDHTPHVNLSNDVPLKDSGTGTAGTLNVYASAMHQHPLNVDPTDANVPLVNATAAANGSSDYYSRNDHVHPQQLTYDGNITATKFIKTGGLAAEVQCANGDTINGVVDIVTDQTVTDIKTFGQIQAQSFKKINGTNQKILLADGTTKSIVHASRQYFITSAMKYIKLCTLNPFFENNCMSVEFKVRGRSGFGLLQYHQTASTAGLNSFHYHFQPNFQSCMQQAYALYFGTETTRTCELWAQMTIWSNLVMVEYTNSGSITESITDILTSEQVDDLPTDYTSMITFTPNVQFEYQTINNAPFTQSGNMQINPTLAADFDDGLRIARTVANTGSTSIELGCCRTSNSGAIQGQLEIYTPSINVAQAPQSFIIAVASQAAQDVTRGLQISAEGNALTFNGSVIAGVGATNGATNGSVNFSVGNPILWSVNSVDTTGGFYSDGPKVYWRAKPITLGAVSP